MIIIDIFARGSCGLVTIGYTSGSGGVWMTAFCAMAVGGCASQELSQALSTRRHPL
ncbi:MAG: hypothetical protein WAV78_03760 [Xanthobacteraceae bacterium]|jgi:hypothetical protein